VTGNYEYSIALARTQSLWNTTQATLGAGSTQTNITLGTTDNATYFGQSMLQTTAPSSARDGSFEVVNASFGLVYYTNGTATSQYFATPDGISGNVGAYFDTAFPSLSVPAALYDDFMKLIKRAFGSLSCDSFGMGCTLDGTCQTFKSDFENYSF
jgi:hypothetical protein